MKNRNYNVIGVMSGTSLDGLDVAFCRFTFSEIRWFYSIENATTINYNNELKKNLTGIHSQNAEEISFMNVNYGKWIGEKVNEFLKAHSITEIDFISSHGHTVFHQPQKRLTLQIGDGNAIVAETGLTVVSDFRSLDVALGGQGAPLVPVGDDILFSEFDFCLNLGGFANISFNKNGKRIAFDICPVNILLNYLANKKGKDFDKGGEMASHGKLIYPLYKKLNSLEFYKMPHPKSLGREWLEKEVIILIDLNNSIPDLLYTCCEHIAEQITSVINVNSKKDNSVLITGGGAFNNFLIKKIQEKTDARIIIPATEIINYKEALIFAFLGVLRMENRINVYSGVTGASRDSCSGSVVWGQEFRKD